MYLGIWLSHIADNCLPAVVYVHMLNADKLLPAVTQPSKNLYLGCISPIKRAAADPNATTRRSDVKGMSSLARTAIAAAWVQAIWTASAPSISSLGAAASIIASAPFIESSETPPQGERAAACIWNKEAFTKSPTLCREPYSAVATNFRPRRQADGLWPTCHPPETP
jgi:hypothetical protein